MVTTEIAPVGVEVFGQQAVSQNGVFPEIAPAMPRQERTDDLLMLAAALLLQRSGGLPTSRSANTPEGLLAASTLPEAGGDLVEVVKSVTADANSMKSIQMLSDLALVMAFAARGHPCVGEEAGLFGQQNNQATQHATNDGHGHAEGAAHNNDKHSKKKTASKAGHVALGISDSLWQLFAPKRKSATSIWN